MLNLRALRVLRGEIAVCFKRTGLPRRARRTRRKTYIDDLLDFLRLMTLDRSSKFKATAGLFTEEPEDDGYDGAHQHHARNRDVDLEIRLVDDDIPGQTPQGDFPEPGPEQADGKNEDADDDECSLHVSDTLPVDK